MEGRKQSYREPAASCLGKRLAIEQINVQTAALGRPRMGMTMHVPALAMVLADLQILES